MSDPPVFVDDPSYEVVRACIDRLRATSQLAALGVTSVYDPPPQGNAITSPYLSLGMSTVERDDATCIGAQEVYFDFDVWSWGAGAAGSSVLARRIANVVATALHDMSLTLTDNRLVNIEHRSTEIFREADGLTNHGVVRFWASVEQR